MSIKLDFGSVAGYAGPGIHVGFTLSVQYFVSFISLILFPLLFRFCISLSLSLSLSSFCLWSYHLTTVYLAFSSLPPTLHCTCVWVSSSASSCPCLLFLYIFFAWHLWVGLCVGLCLCRLYILCLSICRLAGLFVYLSVCLPACLSSSLSIYSLFFFLSLPCFPSVSLYFSLPHYLRLSCCICLRLSAPWFFSISLAVLFSDTYILIPYENSTIMWKLM